MSVDNRYLENPGAAVQRSLGLNFCIVSGHSTGTDLAAAVECEKNQEYLIEKLFEKIESLEHQTKKIPPPVDAQQTRAIKRLTARIERLERTNTVTDVSQDKCIMELKEKVLDLEDLIGAQLPQVLQKIADLVVALDALRGNHGNLMQSVEDNQNGQAADLSQVLATLATIATTLANHQGELGQHTAEIATHGARLQGHDSTLSTHGTRLQGHEDDIAISHGILDATFGLD